MAQKKTARAKIADAVGFPENVMGGVSTVTVYGSSTVIAEGCTAVMSCDESGVRVRLCDGVLCISGRLLLPVRFQYRTLTVSGEIESVSFGQEEKV